MTTRALENFRDLIRIPTISRLDPAETQWQHFDELTAALERLYPLVHGRFERTLVAEHTILLRWPGRTPGDAAVLLAHIDVVAATDEGWMHPPFAAELSGEGAEQLLWGRGTIDNKGAAVAILEALEDLVAADFTPEHDVYVVLGHDEETHGTGAAAVARLLAEQGVRASIVLDEGGAIVEGFLPGVAAPLAAIGVSEKGTALVRLVVDQAGGHASTPPKLSATARLSRAIVRMNAKPFPAALNPTTIALLNTAGDHATGILGFLYRNTWLSRPVLLAAFTRRDESNAMTRTTQAVTILEAGHAANALPERASGVVNIRIAVGSTLEQAITHIVSAIKDPLVKLEVISRGAPMPLSPTVGSMWEALTGTITAVFPEAVPAPYVQTGATDSRSFRELSTAIYRFTPFELSDEERAALHAINERIHVATWLRGIDFYAAFVRTL